MYLNRYNLSDKLSLFGFELTKSFEKFDISSLSFNFLFNEGIKPSDGSILKTEVEQLRAKIVSLEEENTNLKLQIASLNPSYPWEEYYQGFTERIIVSPRYTYELFSYAY